MITSLSYGNVNYVRINDGNNETKNEMKRTESAL